MNRDNGYQSHIVKLEGVLLEDTLLIYLPKGAIISMQIIEGKPAYFY